jgi:hypothetical protein
VFALDDPARKRGSEADWVAAEAAARVPHPSQLIHGLPARPNLLSRGLLDWGSAEEAAKAPRLEH